MSIRQDLIDSCVKSLVDFGYPDANKTTIFTDSLYRRFSILILKTIREETTTDISGNEIDNLITDLSETSHD